MACNHEIKMLLSCYADGETTIEETAKAEEHLGQCAACRKLVDEWKEQRQLLEWAYTSDLPEEVDVMLYTKSTPPVVDMPPAEKPIKRKIWQLNWVGVGAAAAAVIIALGIYFYAALPPILHVGEKLAAKKEPRFTRIGLSIRLRVGPGSEIKRIDDHTIKLEKGWIQASVRHSTDFKVITDLIQVMDKGTVFQVATGPAMDSVLVDEGSVLVEEKQQSHTLRTGEWIMVPRDGKPSIAPSLAPMPGEDREIERLSEAVAERSKILPQNADDMSWEEGLKRLAVRFPNAPWWVGGEGEVYEIYGKKYYCRYAMLCGVRKGLRIHFAQIVRALTGGPVEGNWEIPVGYVQADGIAPEGEHSSNVYYIRLVANNGRMIWRLSGASGRDMEYPVALSNGRLPALYGVSSGVESAAWGIFYDKKLGPCFNLRLDNWPGENVPMLRLSVDKIIPRADFQIFYDEVMQRIAGITGFAMASDFHSANGLNTRSTNQQSKEVDVLYLNPGKKHKFAVIWNGLASIELYMLSKSIKRGNGGSVILAAIASEMPLKEPAVKAGVYLLRLTQQDAHHSPHMELIPLGQGASSAQSAPSYELLNDGPKGRIISSTSWVNYGVHFTFSKIAPGSGTSQFSFEINGRPWVSGLKSDGSTVPLPSQIELHANGCLAVQRP